MVEQSFSLPTTRKLPVEEQVMGNGVMAAAAQGS